MLRASFLVFASGSSCCTGTDHLPGYPVWMDTSLTLPECSLALVRGDSQTLACVALEFSLLFVVASNLFGNKLSGFE